MEWQPIETAPKDGTKILAYNYYRKYAEWTGKDEYDYWIEIAYWDKDGWWINAFAPPGDKYFTHWMPLPTPPDVSRETREN